MAEALFKAEISSEDGIKTVEVYTGDIRNFDEHIDIFTASAFYRSYHPSPRTVYEALVDIGINAEELARRPVIDMRDLCNVWLSDVTPVSGRMTRIGCVEMSPLTRNRSEWRERQTDLLNTLHAYFQMLDIAATAGIPMKTIALPLLGSGNQKIDIGFILTPLLNECISFLKRNSAVSRICFIERSPGKAFQIASAVKDSYAVYREKHVIKAEKQEAAVSGNEKVFISYASEDQKVVETLSSMIEKKGFSCWYAGRSIIQGSYAKAIVKGISEASYFIVMISKNSLQSQHVLNEIDLAFNEKRHKMRILPVRLDGEEMTAEFLYYLSRQQWMEAAPPRQEEKLQIFVDERLMAAAEERI